VPWQALTFMAVQATDQATQFGKSRILPGWLATFGGE